MKIYQNFSQKYYPYELERTNYLIGSLQLLTAWQEKGFKSQQICKIMRFVTCNAELKNKSNKLMIQVSPNKHVASSIPSSNYVNNLSSSSKNSVESIADSLKNSKLSFVKFYISFGTNATLTNRLFNGITKFAARVTRHLKLHKISCIDRKMLLKILTAFAHWVIIDISTHKLYFEGKTKLRKDLKLDLAKLQITVLSRYDDHIGRFITWLNDSYSKYRGRFDSGGADFIQTDSSNYILVTLVYDPTE